MSHQFLTFHGSPGSPRDFSALQTLIPGEWKHQNRHSKDSLDHNENTIFIGYSWGCRELFRYLSRKKVSQAQVVLISPYLFSDPPGGIMKTILNSDTVGNFLFQSFGESIIDKFIQKSSSPDGISSSYLEERKNLLSFKEFRHSLLEKDIFQITEASKELDITVIYGDSDQTSSQEEQIKPLQEYWEPKKFKLNIIKNGGHALVWNRANEVSDIILENLKES